MSLEEIRNKIDKEAKAEAERIRGEASSSAQAILEDARSRASEILKAAKAQVAKEAERITKEQLSGAEVESNSMMINAKESVIGRSIPSVKRQAVHELSTKKMDRLVTAAVKSFAKLTYTSNILVRTGKKNAEVVKKLGFASVPGGSDEISIFSKDGKMSLDASPKAMVEKYDKEARGLLAAKLFGEKK